MKNSSRIIYIIVFLLIGMYLGFSCYKIDLPTENPTYNSLLGQLGNRNKLIVLLTSIAASIFTLFLPVVITCLSFFYQYRFKRNTRVSFIGIFFLSLSISILYLSGTSIHFFEVEYTYNYWLIHIWNFSGTLWILLLALPFKKRILLIHWPFDYAEHKEQFLLVKNK